MNEIGSQRALQITQGVVASTRGAVPLAEAVKKLTMMMVVKELLAVGAKDSAKEMATERVRQMVDNAAKGFRDSRIEHAGEHPGE